MNNSNFVDELSEIKQGLCQLVIFRNLLHDSVVSQVSHLIGASIAGNSDKISELYHETCFMLLDKTDNQLFDGNLWQNYLLQLIAGDENSFSKACQIPQSQFLANSLHKAVIQDVKILKKLYELNLSALVGQKKDLLLMDVNLQHIEYNNIIYKEAILALKKSFVQVTTNEELLQSLAQFYNKVGYGKMNRYIAFRWEKDKGLTGIAKPDPVTLRNLIGYEEQKTMIMKNTEAFLKGIEANNLLLYGERGTGKSSSIKALLKEYAAQGLQIIEVSKYELTGILDILRIVKDRAQKFIVFIDDLSFEEYETEYKYLKAVLEGGLEIKPQNVVIYATSNRRHLVKEKWEDRAESDLGEINKSDSIQEKLSLADRFGITLTYESPNQAEYLKIVSCLAKEYEIDLPYFELKELALRWERWHNTRSGRTARQFIMYLLGELHR